MMPSWHECLIINFQVWFSNNRPIIIWIESRMSWSFGHPLFTIYWTQIVYQNQLLNVPQWKWPSDTLTFLVECNSAAGCKSVLFKIRGYHRFMKMDKATSISSLLLNASCRLIKLLKSIYSEYFLVHPCN